VTDGDVGVAGVVGVALWPGRSERASGCSALGVVLPCNRLSVDVDAVDDMLSLDTVIPLELRSMGRLRFVTRLNARLKTAVGVFGVREEVPSSRSCCEPLRE
jgi:hypothetical protein